MDRSVVDEANRLLLDTLPRPFLTRGGRGASRFRACGVTGFYVAVAVLLACGLVSDSSLLVLAMLALSSGLSFFCYEKGIDISPGPENDLPAADEKVLYRSKMNPVLKKNFAVFPVLDWIATLTTHIPNKGEQLIRYYGYYSNVSRGKRKREKPEDKTEI